VSGKSIAIRLPMAQAARQGAHRAVVALLLAWIRRATTRRALARLPDAALKDLGLTRATAWEEARKPFWRA
jgi:uncharacterized protein YjiS (DUF1127 family)